MNPGFPQYPSNLGQISKSGTVLKSWEHVDFKTDFEIWPRFDGEIKEKPNPTEWIDFDFTVYMLIMYENFNYYIK